jgi:thiamine biosynthesis lipoprotein
VEEELSRAEALFSTWRDDSEVARFNARQSTEPFAVSRETLALIERAGELWRITGGAFDPTLGRLVRLWGFGAWPATAVPSPEKIREALSESGFDKLDAGEGALHKTVPGLWIDVSGIVPGYAVDRVFEALREVGYRRLLVELGGEVRVGSAPPGKKGWRIGIERPEYGGGQSLYRTLELENAALSTSGDYRKWIVQDGKRLSHILDPRSGRPATSAVVSATVVAPDCTTADALATALSVLGSERAIPLVESLPRVACLLLVEAEGGLKELQSSGMKRYLGE